MQIPLVIGHRVVAQTATARPLPRPARRYGQQVRPCAVAAQVERAYRACFAGLSRAQYDGACAITEDGGGGTVPRIDQRRERLRTDEQHAPSDLGGY